MPETLPLFDDKVLAENAKVFAAEALVLLKQAAEEFVAENKDVIVELTTDQVKAILFVSKLKEFALPNLPPIASLGGAATFEQFLTLRDQLFSLVSAAEREHAEEVAELRARAKSAGVKVVTVLMGLGFKALLG
jgi:hypothetical protein